MRAADFWDSYFMGLAQTVSHASKDPSTKCGAVIIDQDRRILSTGYNGLPKGVSDWEYRYTNRKVKYEMVIHAETNAILFARQSLKGSTIYVWPFPTCSRCAALIIQMGISRVVCPPLPDEKRARWSDSIEIAKVMYGEACVNYSEFQQ